MKTLSTQKRLAAEILNVGKDRVYFNPFRIEDISQAITRMDIKELIKERGIMKKIMKKQKRKKKKNRKGTGKIKMRVKKRKEKYIAKIRKLRRYLLEIKEKGIISREEYRKLRRLAKSGHFKTRRHLKEYLSNVMKRIIEDEKTDKSTVQKKKAK